MTDPVTSEHAMECAPLLELATPDIYRRNLFRVLGLAVNVTPKDVQRQQNRRRMQEKLGLGVGGSGGPLALDPPPQPEDLRAAIERLNRPLDRVVHELFWFWPTSGNVAGDSALEALEQGDVTRASELWREQAGTEESREIAAHNLAVLDHLVALDHEFKLGAGTLGGREKAQLGDLWRQAFARWQEVLAGDGFWSALRTRLAELNDAQLTTGLVRRLRATMPTALLLVSARIAYSAAERGDGELARRHTKLLRDAGLGDDLADVAIREALAPARSRITTAIDHTKDAWKRTPQLGNRHVRELAEQAGKLLSIVDAMLAADDPTRVGLHDMVADAMLDGQVIYGQKTNAWRESIDLLTIALSLAAGEAVKSRLTENIAVLEKNEKSGNDWCAPGYWSLPADVISQLEAARDRAKTGDYETAIRIVAVLDPAIGEPFRRALAFCLSERAWQIAGNATTESNQPTAKLQKFLDVIRREGSVHVPTPQMSSWELPTCPCCGSRSYQSWLSGEFNGQRFWMCTSCSTDHNRERDDKKAVLRTKVSKAMEYELLAIEIDPRDPGLKESLVSLKKIAKDIGARIPSTKALKQLLGRDLARRVAHSFTPATALVCFFCGQSPGDQTCQITVPMWGDVRSVDLLFGTGVEYRSGSVIVPRCTRCGDEHRAFPIRIETWQNARLAAAGVERFRQAFDEVRQAASAAREAAKTAEHAKAEAAKDRAALEKAEAIGTRCPQCDSPAYWRGHLCNQCDSVDLQLSLRVMGGLALAVFLVAAVQSLASAIPLPFALALAVGFKRQQWGRRSELRTQRKTELEHRRKTAVEEARCRLDQTLSALAAAESAAGSSKAIHEEKQAGLDEAKRAAVEAFERENPAPQLQTGVKPEDAYVNWPPLDDLRGKGWRYGTERSQTAADSPIEVGGRLSGTTASGPVTKPGAGATSG